MTIKNLGGGAAAGGNASVNFSAGTTSSNLGSVVFSNSNGISFGLNGSTITGTVAATSSLVAGNANISISTNGSTISVNGIGAGTGITTGSTTGVVQAATLNSNGLSTNEPYMTRFMVPDAQLQTVVSAPGNASISFVYVSVPTPVTGSRIDLLMAHSGGSSASNTTGGFVYSGYAAIYTINAASLSSLSSGSTQTTFTWNSNSAGQTQFTQSNIIPMSVPVNFNMPPGEYIVGVNVVTAATGNAMGNTWSVMGGNNLQTALVYADLASSAAASRNLLLGMGVYSAASTGLSAAYSLSGIVMTGSSLSQANVALVFRNA